MTAQPRLLVIVLICLLPALLHSQANDYSVSQIPKVLMREADMVVRHASCELIIEDEEKATLLIEEAITILDSRDDKWAVWRKNYDEFRDVKFLEGAVYDAQGNRISKARRKDIVDVSANQGSGVGDNRMLMLDLQQRRHPYTVWWRYEVDYKGLLHLPSWTPQVSKRQSVMRSEMKVTVPSDLGVRYHLQNLPEPERRQTEEGEKLYWSVENLTPISDVAYNPYWSELVPLVLLAPNRFEMDQYAGSMTTWQDLGKWQAQLLDERDVLPETVQAEVRALVADASSRRDTLRRLYQYMQGRTRYLSIQLGIGGWQPFPAEFVHEKQYGDCKALSNYMKALYDCVGIESHYALVRSRAYAPALVRSFPSNQFNHAILCVPNRGDTIWLECTSQTQPFGYLGTHTDDREVLLITDDGGKVVRTTKYPAEINLEAYRGELTLAENGTAQGKLLGQYRGLMYDWGLEHLLTGTEVEQKEWLQDKLHWSSWQIDSMALSFQAEEIPQGQLSFAVNVQAMANRSGNRLFWTPLLRGGISPPALGPDRNVPVVARRGFKDIDSLIVNLPQNFTVEYLPKPVEIDSPFGHYRMSLIASPGKLIYRREFMRKAGTHPADTFAEWVEFCEAVARADREQVVLVNKS